MAAHRLPGVRMFEQCIINETFLPFTKIFLINKRMFVPQLYGHRSDFSLLMTIQEEKHS